MTKPHAHRKRRWSAFWGVVSLVKYRVWLGTVLLQGNHSHAVPGGCWFQWEQGACCFWFVQSYLAFSSQKYMSIKLLLFFLLCFLLLALLSALHWIPFCSVGAWSASLLLLALCLPAWGLLGGIGCLDASALVHECKQLCLKHGASTLERLTAFFSLKSC